MLLKERLIAGIDVIGSCCDACRVRVRRFFDTVMVGIVNPADRDAGTADTARHVERFVSDHPCTGKGGDHIAVRIVGVVGVDVVAYCAVDAGDGVGSNTARTRRRISVNSRPCKIQIDA